MSTQNNEGEGNRTAAKQYSGAQKTFAQDTFAGGGKVDAAAKDAAKAVDGPENSDLCKAEEVGKRHAHGEDPQLKK
jgi:hypothetical protein